MTMIIKELYFFDHKLKDIFEILTINNIFIFHLDNNIYKLFTNNLIDLIDLLLFLYLIKHNYFILNIFYLFD